MAFDSLEVPANLKSIVPYLKIATQHEDRDLVVTYWARLYALQAAIKIGKSPEERSYLVKLMGWLETFKKEHHDNDAITNEVAAQAHLENWALKLFLFADENDRAANFSMNVIQSFYTAGMLYDVLTTFGDLTDEAAQNRKYAKWKAAYIHSCIKNGQTPVPGPKEENEGDAPASPKPVDDMGSLEDETENAEQEENKEEPEPPTTEPEPEPEATDSEVEPEPSEVAEESSEPALSNDDPEVQPTPPPSNDAFGFPPVPNSQSNTVSPGSKTSYPNLPGMPESPSPASSPMPKHKPAADYSTHQQTGNIIINAEQMNKTQKYIKWAGSAINYDDIPTAIENLQKALHLLTTGQDS